MITYKYEPENKRVAAYIDGKTEIGEITYKIEGEVWDANHTFVEPAHRGTPIAGEMLRLLVEKAREFHKDIHPTCPYVVKVMDRTPEYHEVLRREL